MWAPDSEEADDRPVMVDPNKWMPISDELGLRADAARFAACREATRKAVSRRAVEMAPLQRLLLGPHASISRSAIHEALDDSSSSRSPSGKLTAQTQSSNDGASPSPKKKRQHRIFTAAAGFVSYVG